MPQMDHVRWTFWKVTLMAAASAAGAALAGAAEPGDDQAAAPAQARSLVREAMLREILGDDAGRAELLARAAEADDLPEAHWAQGRVRSREGWASSEDMVREWASDSRLRQYRQLRDEAADTVQDQWSLAVWCDSHKLSDQAVAHAHRVITLEPEHVAAREALGHRRIDGRWVTAEQLAAAVDQVESELESFRAWERTIQRLARRIDAPNERIHDEAIAELRAIADVDALVAIETILGRRSERTAREMVTALASFDVPAASEALARQALVSDWPVIRRRAAEQLRDRDPIEYVPALLAELQGTVTLVSGAMQDGRCLLHRQMLVEEGQESRNVFVSDVRYRRRTMPGGIAGETLQRMVGQATDSLQASLQQGAAVNQRRWASNAAVVEVLRTATGQDLENDPQVWWDWWNANQGIQVSQKQVSVVGQSSTVDVYDVSRLPSSQGPSAMPTVSAAQRHECLAAGTIVSTDRGEIAIEQVRVGDRVLAQDVETGEVDYRAVLQCTVREPTDLVEFQVDDEWIRASEGHPFWVAGEGWKLARELETGMILHGQNGGRTVLDVRTAESEVTYNLRVEGFATFFVGRQRVLGHDVTTRTAVEQLVPGLMP